jgi:hypothetical protein
VAGGWCWFVLREKHCWLVAAGWFVLREKYCWLVADKPNEQGAHIGRLPRTENQDKCSKSNIAPSALFAELQQNPFCE